MTGSSNAETDETQCDHLGSEQDIEAGARAFAEHWGYQWKCICSSDKGLDCDCGDALYEERNSTQDECPSRQELRSAVKKVLKAVAQSQGDRTADPSAEASVEPEGKTP